MGLPCCTKSSGEPVCRLYPGEGGIVHGRPRSRPLQPLIREFYGRPFAVGKPKNLALVACMRKLLVVLNAMLKHRDL